MIFFNRSGETGRKEALTQTSTLLKTSVCSLISPPAIALGLKKTSLNWELLIFLTLFLNVKLWVKVLAIIIVLIQNRKKLLPIKPFQNKLLFFYLFILIVGVLNIAFHSHIITTNYLVAASTGMIFWLLAAFASYQCYRYTETIKPKSIHATLTLFFILNILLTCSTLIRIIIETGAINPYTYQGLYQKYFITTGDYLRGITFDTSTTNACLNSFGVVYFLIRKKAFLTIACMAGLLLTGSNLTNLLLTCVLVYIFIFQSNKDQKSLVAGWVICLVVFMIKISPQNNIYVQESFARIFKKDTLSPADTSPVVIKKTDSLLTIEERKQQFARSYLDSMATIAVKHASLVSGKYAAATDAISPFPEPATVKPGLPKDDIHSVPFQRKKVQTALQSELIKYVKKDKAEDSIIALNKDGKRIPGKLTAFKQTLAFFKSHPLQLLTGTGMGNFSSKLAFRTTGLDIAGGYPAKYIYINKDFRENHLAIFLYYFSNDAQYHSIINTPNSIYDQLLSEYGLAGLIIFVVFYIGYFAKNIKWLTYGIPLLLIITGAFFIDYWFEQLSIVVIFELMVFLNIHENKLVPDADQC